MLHLLGDFFLQPGKWANNKTEKFMPLFYHSLQYTIPFILAFYFLEINLLFSILIFGSHLAIDNRKVLNWWNKKIRGEKNFPDWAVMVQDQTLHILVILAVVFLDKII